MNLFDYHYEKFDGKTWYREEYRTDIFDPESATFGPWTTVTGKLEVRQ